MRIRWIRRAVAPTFIAGFALSSTSCALFETPDVTDVISGVQSLSGVAGSFVDGAPPKAPDQGTRRRQSARRSPVVVRRFGS